jgi:hypothetical protein
MTTMHFHGILTATRGTERANPAARPAARLVHVLCSEPSGYRWLRAHVRGATQQDDRSFLVHDEGNWSYCLTAAQGREVASHPNGDHPQVMLCHRIALNAARAEDDATHDMDVDPYGTAFCRRCGAQP